MDELNRTELIIRKHIKNIYTALPGTITKVDPVKMMAQVKISRTEPYGPLETGWLKIKTLYAGKDYGLAFVPYVNDECVVCFQNKKLNDGFILVFAWSESNPPPEHDLPLRIGDCLLKHKKGTWILLDKDGNIKVFHKTGTVMTITEAGDCFITHNKGHVVMIKADMVDGRVKRKIEGNMGEYKLISLEDTEGDTQARIEVGGDTGLVLRSMQNQAHIQGRVMSRNIITLQETADSWYYEIKNAFGCHYSERLYKGNKDGVGEIIHVDKDGPCGFKFKNGIISIIGSFG